MEYKKVKLKDIFEKPISGEWGKEAEEDSISAVFVIRTTNFSNDGRMKVNEIVKREIDQKKVDQKKLEFGDIIIEKSGGSPTQPVGRVIFFDIDSDETYLCNNFTSILRCKKRIYSKYVLHYLFYQHKTRKVLNFQNKTTGIINLQLSRYLEKIEIPLPPIEIQIKIANALDKAQELVDNRKAQIEKYDEFLQSIFLDMFGDPVTNPKEWEVKTVEKVCNNIFGGGTPSKSNLKYYLGEIPWVTPKDMKRLYIYDSRDHINEEAIKSSSTKLIPLNSLLMVIRSGILKKKLPVAINKKEVTLNQDMKGFVVDKNILNVQYLLYFFLESQSYLLSKVRAVTADNIEFKQIKEMKIPLPPLEVQNQFASIVEKVESNKKKLEDNLAELENNFNSIMQRAFRGELF